MIKGIGTDIIEIERIKQAVNEHGTKFLNRIFTKRELAYCEKRGKLRFPELSVRFAAKEAYSKALGTGMKGIKWNEIEVLNNDLGKPHIALKGKIMRNIHVSLSHSANSANAIVIIEETK